MMIVRDDFSRYARVYFLRSKDEAVRYFRKFIAEIHPRRIEKVRSDGGGEFLRESSNSYAIRRKSSRRKRLLTLRSSMQRLNEQ